jgi:hypothetical protein
MKRWILILPVLAALVAAPCLAQEKGIVYLKNAEKRVIAYLEDSDYIGSQIAEERALYRWDSYRGRMVPAQDRFGDHKTGYDTVVWDGIEECDMIGRQLVFKGKLAFTKDGVAYIRLKNTYRMKDLNKGGQPYLTSGDREAIARAERDLAPLDGRITRTDEEIERLEDQKKPGPNKELNKRIKVLEKEKRGLIKKQKGLKGKIRKTKTNAGKRCREACHLLMVELDDKWLPPTKPNITVEVVAVPSVVEWDPRNPIPVFEIQSRFVKLGG